MARHLRFLSIAGLGLAFGSLPSLAQNTSSAKVFGYVDFSQQAKWDATFMAVPNAKLAGEELKILTAEPHWASSPQDKKTADYVAEKFKAAGLQTEIVPFRVWLNKPVKIEITAFDADGKQLMSGPTPEHVDPKAYGGDPYQDNPDILPAFNGSSPSGDVTADVVYANYGTLADFDRLKQLNVDVKGKIVIVRYGQNFRGVKVYIAQQRGAAGVIIYSDPADDGYDRGDKYPRGAMRPDSGVQRGSVQFLPIYPGDPTTPGIASTPDLPDSKRITDPAKMNQPSIPSNPLSYKDAAPILEALDGPATPRDWQGGLPFTYHLGGTGAVKVHMHLEQDYQLRTIWDVIGTIDGSDPDQKNDWVVAGNHRDAWVFGAVDPNSGTAAMLEAVHGLGELLQQGWKPKRRIVICSWDAEEEGLMGSTEWAEDHAAQLAHAVAYFNTDVGVSGPNFNASAVPSLKEFVRDVTRQVPSPKGGTVYEQWQKSQSENPRRRGTAANPFTAASNSTINAESVRVGDLGSGSDYTPFIQHLGVPSTDIGSDGPYGVYHSAFDDYNWFIRNADPTFVYEQQQARVFGLEILHMADADVLPYDYKTYGTEVVGYLKDAERHAAEEHLDVDFAQANAAAARFAAAGARIETVQSAPGSLDAAAKARLNDSLRNAEEALLNEAGLPHRPWYKHTIYAPGEYTGYAAVVIPGVNEGIEAKDAGRTSAQLTALTDALNRSASILESAGK
ncbi:MAG TPA: M28 family metallopeptidase [Candidatus Aquilonibacter sp.]|nr:M28 family metallopeptidase [Candidatus Aquilonibacter sp.]